MTKPVTSVAAMMLYEEGAFELNDPIRSGCPGSPRPACTSPGRREPVTVPQVEPIRVGTC